MSHAEVGKKQSRSGWERAIGIIALLLAFFHLYTGLAGVLPHMQQRALHVLFALTLLFLTTAAGKSKRAPGKVPWWDIVICIVIAVASLNIVINHETYFMQQGAPPPPEAFVLGTMMLVIALEAGRRATGIAIPILALLMIGYTFWGKYIPGYWGFPGISYQSFISTIYMYDRAIWGPLTSASASLIAMFILFTSFLEATGGTSAFIKIASFFVGKYRGGPGMMTVVSTGLVGMITGSVVANVVTVGPFSIPLMKRSGYRSEFAAGLVALASCGGQIMPPVMGTGAFIMAELTGISYFKIMLSAFIPACLFFFTCLCAVRFEAIRTNMSGMPKEEIGRGQEILTWSVLGPVLPPIAVLIYFIVIGYSPYTSAFYALVLAFVIFVFADLSPAGMKSRLKKVLPALEKGARSLGSIAALVVVAGIFVALLFQTGLGAKVSGGMLALGGTSIILSVLLAYIVLIILGTGVPITATYILGASVLAPTLIKLGLSPLNAHFFIFFTAVLSDITPPTCPGIYAAALISGSPWGKAAWVSMKTGFLAFALPFLFVIAPAFLLQGTVTEIITAVVTAVIGIVAITGGVIGSLNTPIPKLARPFLIIGGVLFWFPGTYADIAGVVILAATVVLIWCLNRAKPKTATV